jgi:hypothetical protein
MFHAWRAQTRTQGEFAVSVRYRRPALERQLPTTPGVGRARAVCVAKHARLIASLLAARRRRTGPPRWRTQVPFPRRDVRGEESEQACCASQPTRQARRTTMFQLMAVMTHAATYTASCPKRAGLTASVSSSARAGRAPGGAYASGGTYSCESSMSARQVEERELGMQLMPHNHLTRDVHRLAAAAAL